LGLTFAADQNIRQIRSGFLEAQAICASFFITLSAAVPAVFKFKTRAKVHRHQCDKKKIGSIPFSPDIITKV